MGINLGKPVQMGIAFGKPALDTFIQDLPNEILINIFKNISLHELVTNCTKICVRWREIIVQSILRPNIVKIANANGKFKKDILEDGWTYQMTDTKVILSLYQKYEFYSSKF